jgi:hypothetical protein
MPGVTEQQLKEARDQQSAWLRQQPGYTGSVISHDKQGEPVLVLQFHPVTPDLRRQLAQKFPDIPIEVRDIPMARAY